MEKASKSSLWTEEGYELFAAEGLDGIQVERLSRILQLNKSSFYHYFVDMEGFCHELIQLHRKKIDLLLLDVLEIKKLDPDYLLLLVRYTSTVMFQVQLTRNKDQYSFYDASTEIDLRVSHGVRHLWVDYLGSNANSEHVMRYYDFVRDMFYTRVSFRNFNFQFLYNLITDAKVLIDQVNERVSPGTAKTHSRHLDDSV